MLVFWNEYALLSRRRALWFFFNSDKCDLTQSFSHPCSKRVNLQLVFQASPPVLFINYCPRKNTLSDNIFLEIYSEIFTSGHITGDSLEIVGENIFGHWTGSFSTTCKNKETGTVFTIN